MRVNLQPSYILHSRPYRDSSSLLEVFTAEFGRLSLVARGVRRQSRGGSKTGQLQPFTPLLISYSGRSELKTLATAEAAGAPLALSGERLYSAMYLNELLVRLLHHHDAHPRLFAAYGQALEALSGSQLVDSTLRRFEIGLLDELGYQFDPATDAASGDPVEAEIWYQYHPDIGLVASHRGAGGSAGCYLGADLLAMARGDFDGGVRMPAKRLLRQALAIHLGSQPLRSRELFLAGRSTGQDEIPPGPTPGKAEEEAE